jgi:hypothetical protein
VRQFTQKVASIYAVKIQFFGSDTFQDIAYSVEQFYSLRNQALVVVVHHKI